MSASCEKVPLLAPTASIITVLASRDVLPINGNAQIIATVVEQSGTAAHNGTLVTFTTTLGTLDPQDAVTSNGQATVMLRAGTQSGVAQVSAFSGSASSESPVMVTIGAAAAATLSVTASPATIPAAGGTVTLSAKPSDANGNLLPGVPVSFTSDAGTLSANTAVSDSLGEARTTLTTDRDTVVTASIGTQTATVTVRVNLLPTVTVSTTAAAPTAGEPISFTVNTAVGSSPIRKVTIDFGDGTVRSLGSLTGSTAVTHTYSSTGTFNVVVTATDTSGGIATVATVVVVEGAAPLNVTVTSTPTNVQVGVAVIFTATVTQTTGTFEIDRYVWTFGDGGSATTTGNSTSHVYSSSGHRTVEVQVVEKDGRVGSGRVEVNVTPRSPLNVNLVTSPATATIADTVTFTATVSGSTVPIARYEWEFGDGTELVTTGNVVNHVYTTSGTFTVHLRVFSVEGDYGETTLSLIVVPLQVEIAITANPSSPRAGDPVSFTATITPPTIVATQYDWVFGDGFELPNGGRVPNPHVYAAAGTFTVKVTAHLADPPGGLVETQALIVVTLSTVAPVQ